MYEVHPMHAPTVAQIQGEVALYARTRESLRYEYPALDDETLSDTLEGLTDLREIIAELLRSALEDEAFATAISTRIIQMKGRQARLSNRSASKRALALRAMVQADITKLQAADLSAFVRKAPPVLEIVAEERIPSQFWKPQPPKLDRQQLLEALKSGVEIDGAAISQSQVQLSVRTR